MIRLAQLVARTARRSGVRGLIPVSSECSFDHETFHQDNMSVCFIAQYTPLLYSKTGVYRDIHYFFLFLL